MDADDLLTSFLARLETATERALLLDYDGTLAPFRRERDRAVPYPGVREALTRILSAGHTRLVVITGRGVEDVIPLLGIDPLPEIWGSHGRERRRAGGATEVLPLEPLHAQGLATALQAMKLLGAADGCERKPAGLALHWRGLEAPERERLRRLAISQWTELAGRTGLRITEFDGGVELRVPGVDKGDAVRAVLGEMSRPAAAYLGDDATDEDAFRAIAGTGLAILVRSEWKPTMAQVWLQPPEELLAFLDQWHRRAERGPDP